MSRPVLFALWGASLGFSGGTAVEFLSTGNYVAALAMASIGGFTTWCVLTMPRTP